MDDVYSYRPSGCALPHILQCKKARLAKSGPSSSSSSSNHAAKLPLSEQAKSLTELLKQSDAMLSEIQRQLIVGEETYFEETSQHGNIYRGFEGFLDMKMNGGSMPVTSNKRRMPLDDRYFSQSCVHIKAAAIPYVSHSKPSTIASSGSSVAPTTNMSNAHVHREKNGSTILPPPQVSSANITLTNFSSR